MLIWVAGQTTQISMVTAAARPSNTDMVSGDCPDPRHLHSPREQQEPGLSTQILAVSGPGHAYLFIVYVYVCVCMSVCVSFSLCVCMCMCYSAWVEVRAQLAELVFSF